MSTEKVCCPSCHHYGNNQHERDQVSYRCGRCGTTWPRVDMLDDTQYCPMCEETGKQLEAAKQRELELLAVIKRLLDYSEHDVNCSIYELDHEGKHCECNCGLADIANGEHPRALREHEAKMIEPYEEAWDDLLEDMELHGMHKFEPYIKSKAKFRRMAEERGKK